MVLSSREDLSQKSEKDSQVNIIPEQSDKDCERSLSSGHGEPSGEQGGRCGDTAGVLEDPVAFEVGSKQRPENGRRARAVPGCHWSSCMLSFSAAN